MLSNDILWWPAPVVTRYPAQAIAILAVCRAPLYAVANHLSADTPLIEASARSRLTIARMLSSSSFDVACGFTSSRASNCFQLMLITFYKLNVALQYGRQ